MKKIKLIITLLILTLTIKVNAVAVGYNFNLINATNSYYDQGGHIVEYPNGKIKITSGGMGCAIATDNGLTDGGCSEKSININFYPNNNYYPTITIDGIPQTINNNYYNLYFQESGKKNITVTFNLQEQPKQEPITQTQPTNKEEQIKEEVKQEEKKDEEKEEVKITKLENNNIEFISDKELNNNYKLVVQDITKEQENNKTLKDYKIYNVYEIDIKDNNNEIIKIDNGNYKIRIKKEKQLQNKNNLKVIYINNNKIEEMKTTILDNYIEFETTHLSKYAIVENKTIKTNTTVKKESNNLPIIIGISIMIIILITITIIILNNNNNNKKR